MRRVLRELVPVDDQVHELAVTGPIVHVAARREDAVDVWWVYDSDVPERVLLVRVFGTGHLVPAGPEYLGTAVTPSGRLVWHLFADPA